MRKLLAIFLLLTINAAQAQIKTTSTIGKISFPTKEGNWTLQQYAKNIIKATFQPKGYTANENISDAVIAKPLNTEIKQWLEDKNPNRSIQWKDFMVEVKDGSISFGPHKPVSLTATFQASGFRGFQFQLHDGEKIFGGGERALPLNRRGYKFNLYNNPWYGYSEGADNLNYSVPFFTSSNGYGLFFDNPSKGYADIGKTNSNVFEVGFSSSELNVYIILGKDYKEILQSYHKLTGTQPLPPRWALGNLMSRFGYTSEAQVKSILDSMRYKGIPVDAVIFDLFWFGDSIKQTMGNLDWVNKKAWPNPEKMIADFRKNGINTILITEPFVVKSSLNYNESKPFHAVDSLNKPYLLKDFYFGEAGLIDIFRKDAQQWFWNKHKPQMNNGVEAWWGDLGEPEKHPSNLYHNLKDFGFKRLFKADEVHNLYGHTWTKMLYNYYAKEYPNKRLFSLNRSGFAGSQRYGIFPWTGDVSRSWSGLRSQLQVLLGMSMSGVPYVHSDAGGFAGGEGDNELYIRWLQMAAFTPIFRPHGTALYEVDKNAFSFPSEAALIDTPYRYWAEYCVRSRYFFLPYNYTLAYEQSKHGKPLIAPLYYHFPTDSVAAKVEDEFMWGENILVTPILHKGSDRRKAYLPAGEWYEFSTNKKYNGNQWIDKDVPLSEYPIFVKAGSFLPYSSPFPSLDRKIPLSTQDYDSLTLQVFYYPSQATTEYHCYSDDGVSKQNQNSISFVHFKGSTTNKKMSITISVEQKPKSHIKEIAILFPQNLKYPFAASLNGTKLDMNSTLFKTSFVFSRRNKEGSAIFEGIKIPFTGETIQLEVELE
jgi:oligosaccharide 4-alpha-D-glucosyltransferase